MASATFEDHPTDPDKVILRKPRHEDDDDIQEYKKPWVGLTEEDIKFLDLANYIYVVRIVEAKLKEKNA
jgi:hypothetical protein